MVEVLWTRLADGRRPITLIRADPPLISFSDLVTDIRPDIRTVNVTRYVTPLREGGSLPAIVEADDDGMYVLKFKGAGQGVKALVAELICGEIARLLGLRVPEIVFANLDALLSRAEPDPEIQDLLSASVGVNLGLDYLPGSITFDPLVEQVDEMLASQIVWFDSFVTNVDRTPRNTNLLVWHKQLWLIDHGAALYFQHAWDNWQQQVRSPFSLVRDHVLLPLAGKLDEADQELKAKLHADDIAAIVAAIPAEWLGGEAADDKRQVYTQYLTTRLAGSKIFVEEAVRARQTLI